VHLHPGTIDCLIVNGGVIVQILNISYVQTFAEYADKVFMKRLLEKEGDWRRNLDWV